MWRDSSPKNVKIIGVFLSIQSVVLDPIGLYDMDKYS